MKITHLLQPLGVQAQLLVRTCQLGQETAGDSLCVRQALHSRWRIVVVVVLKGDNLGRAGHGRADLASRNHASDHVLDRGGASGVTESHLAR